LSKRDIIWLAMLSCVLILMALPRFNWNDVGAIKSLTGGTHASNSDQYIDMTLYFRGEKPADGIHSPYAYRPLVPLLASKLPFEAMTAINLINLAAIVAAMISLYCILAWLKFGFRLRVIGCGMFVVSFPTFYYTTIGFIDPVAVFIMAIGLYLIFLRKWVWLAVAVFFGTLVKETSIVLVLALAIYLFFDRRLFTKEGLALPLIFLAFAAGLYISRTLIPVSPGYVWIPSFDNLMSNLLRPRSSLSFLLSFGVPGIVSVFIFHYRKTGWFHERLAETLCLIAGVAIAIILHIYSMIAAFADGRIIWLSYPFLIPLAVIVFDEMGKQRKQEDRGNYTA
ncbi:MAG: hypothetical protein WCU00_11480, partial [Candidatus Latescibacterota bacterium]